MNWNDWQGLTNLLAKNFVCGFCGKDIGSTHGYLHRGSGELTRIYICTFCGSPTFFSPDGTQLPGPLIGRNIEKLPDDIEKIYREIRDSIKNADYTAAQLLGRKLIMHLAVSVANAKEGETFVQYVEHLKRANYVPPNGEKWINYIRSLGNEKNHEIKTGSLEEAKRILKFIEVLLIFIYEFSEEKEGEVNET